MLQVFYQRPRRPVRHIRDLTSRHYHGHLQCVYIRAARRLEAKNPHASVTNKLWRLDRTTAQTTPSSGVGVVADRRQHTTLSCTWMLCRNGLVGAPHARSSGDVGMLIYRHVCCSSCVQHFPEDRGFEAAISHVPFKLAARCSRFRARLPLEPSRGLV